jgi:RHS repeat-associated protein
VCDNETALYYLQSRYYDPELGRFINADAFASTGQGILGNNMFSYCLNNPVTHADAGGNLPSGIINPNAMTHNGGSIRPISDKERKERELRRQSRCLFNTSEEAVLYAQDFAFYKGVLYVKVPGKSGFSFGMVFFSSEIDDINLVRHEYGHTQQLDLLGVEDYLINVVSPSVICFWLSRDNPKLAALYYYLPWEYVANQYGGVPAYSSAACDAIANIYWDVVQFISLWR